MSKFKERVGEGWFNCLSPFFPTDEFKAIREVLKGGGYFPHPPQVFRALELTKWDDVRVVILGQDPYYNFNNDSKGNKILTATGLAFGIAEDAMIVPPSLKNIFEELEKEYDQMILNPDYTLESWAKQGVLLLNTALTVVEGTPGAHTAIWKPFTEHVIKSLNEQKEGLVWILWGNHAKGFKKFIDPERHDILESAHPSPLSADKGFKGNGHFIMTNDYLFDRYGIGQDIDWFEGINQPPF